ncbi:aminoacyl-tRNA hydrolase [Pseudohaliea rubra]|uniref:Peptidyl-tRNA hydrolase n=1 Tax=Pseudohaliea rubra DSM 19751 TaxID=1265313 RepID=A0A095VTK6_9GAMM|nr:aminoacyl-tRNA hydrolase [Pseudohaliea rubra]KGE04792.1 Peptidyl-tRNA hydrolase [Pseudohaliea rubra DSM 19751]
MGSSIRLIVGLGNPGDAYRGTRHNAGADFVSALALRHGTTLAAQGKFFGDTAQLSGTGQGLRLLIPTTWMNRSGKAVAALAGFYRIAPAEILIAHDELDIPAGCARFKRGGGHGGHNGLRDIIPALGNSSDFFRLRIGIGHPGSAAAVSGYVLGRAPAAEAARTEAAIDAALDALPLLLAGDLGKAQTQLHSFSAP